MDNATPDTNRPTPFEDTILSYELTRLNGPDLEFRNVTLKVPVGDHPVGTKFVGALLSTAGALVLYVDEDKANAKAYHLTVQVGTEIDIKALWGAPCNCGDPLCPTPASVSN